MTILCLLRGYGSLSDKARLRFETHVLSIADRYRILGRDH
jgi:hypothetical protein